MSFINNQTLVASTSQAINKAKLNGVLKLRTVYIFQLLDYYINFTQYTINSGSELYTESNEFLRGCIKKLVYGNPNTLCNYKLTTDLTIPNISIIEDPNDNVNVDSNSDSDNSGGDNTEHSNNTAPTVSGTTIDIGESNTYSFVVSDFTTNFQDAENDTYRNVILYLNGVSGIFKYNNVVIDSTLEIPVANVVNLEYTRAAVDAFSEPLTFRISDDNAYSLNSIVTTNTLTGDLVVVNQPATIGDNTIVVDNRTLTTLTLAMFTTQLTPPYDDPEGDLIDAIRVDIISVSNVGIFYYNATPIVEGLIISKEDLIAGLFTHEGPEEDTIETDVFTFSARDEGSQIWVQ